MNYKKVFIIALIVFIVLLSLGLIFTLINSSEDDPAQELTNFTVPSGWEKMSTNSYKYNTSNPRITLLIISYGNTSGNLGNDSDEAGYNSSYKSSIKNSSSWTVQNVSNESISGIVVKSSLSLQKDGFEYLKEYYFEKNGQFYSVSMSIYDENGVNETQLEKYGPVFEDTIDEIVKTINIR